MNRTSASAWLAAVSGVNLLAWLTQGGPIALVGAVMAVVLLVKATSDSGSRGAVWGWFVFLALAGWLAALLSPGPLMVVHTLWVVGFGVGLVAQSKAESGPSPARSGAASPRAQRKAEKARLEANRQAHLAYAARIEREQKFQQRASRPGAMTGYEPAALDGVVLDPSRFAHMYGEPGAGLAGAGFDAAAVARGVEGELNFARAMARDGLLERFATFWSVHMPDEAVGASTQFQADIDCVVVTGKSVWLLDMKNYNQGDVTWSTQVDRDENGADQLSLIAIDNVTGGQVGEKRKMSLNMKMATERFQRRFQDNGVRFQVQRAVVMMPRPDGLGTVKDVTWAGGVPVAGLPHVLAWLSKEQPFNPRHPDATVLLAMLKPLIKDQGGSAPVLGQLRRPSRAARPQTAGTAATPTPAAPVAATPTPAAPVAAGAAPASAPPVVSAPASPEKRCGDCGTVVESSWTICENCGDAL